MSNGTLLLWGLSLSCLMAAMVGMYLRLRGSLTSFGLLAAASRQDEADLMAYQAWKRRHYQNRTLTLDMSLEFEAAFTAGRRSMRDETR